MTPGDKVTLARADAPSYNTPATIEISGDNDQACMLSVSNPPRWFRRLLQARGIFLGSKSSYRLSLYRDHSGRWTDSQTLNNHYTITTT